MILFWGIKNSELLVIGYPAGGRVLEEAIARNIFRGNSSPEPIAVLAAYVRREALSIDGIPETELLGGQLTFGPAPE